MRRLTDLQPTAIVDLVPTPSGPRPVTLERASATLLVSIARGDGDEAALLARYLAHRLRVEMGWAKF